VLWFIKTYLRYINIPVYYCIYIYRINVSLYVINKSVFSENSAKKKDYAIFMYILLIKSFLNEKRQHLNIS